MQNLFVKTETFKSEPNKKHNKAGLDANVLVDFVLNPLTLQFVFEKIIKSELFTCSICKKEAIYILKDKYKIKNAEQEITNLSSSLKIKLLCPTNKDYTDGSKILEKFRDIGAHEPDVFILACFKNNGVTDVLSINNDFLRTAEAIGLTPRKVDTMDKINEKMFKNLFRH
jgi:predicted nucleic acid-binding protein